MAINITRTEWAAAEQELLNELQRRWPWLVRNTPYTAKLRLENAAVAAAVELEASGCNGSVCAVKVLGSSTCSGGLLELVEFGRLFAEMRDAMSYLHSAAAPFLVWRDGHCPCDYCSGTGRSVGRLCVRCNGTGKR